MVEERTELDERMSEYSDFHKEAYGFRPSPNVMRSIARWTDVDYQYEISRLTQTMERNRNQQAIDEANAVAEFEAEIVKLIGLGAADRATAIRWIVDAERVGGDMEYLRYTLGLPNDYLF